jgi:hypothetical protein
MGTARIENGCPLRLASALHQSFAPSECITPRIGKQSLTCDPMALNQL